MPRSAKNDISQIWRQVKDARAELTLAISRYYEISERLKKRLAKIKDEKQLQAIRNAIHYSK